MMFSIFFVAITLFALFIPPADAEEMADLAVEEIYPDIPEPQAGDDVIFTLEYANIGTSGTNESFVILFFVDGELAGETEVFPLDPGESGSADFFIHIENDFGGGEHSATAVIDPGEKVPESDEWNNEFSEFFYVAEIEETEIEETGMEESEIEETSTEESDIEENGMDESEIEESNSEESDVEESDVEESDVEESDVEESDVEETDVEESGTEEPDLVVEEISWSPDAPKTEDQLVFSVEYANRGTGSSEQDFCICLYVDDSLIAYEWVDALQAGESAIYEHAWTVDRSVLGGDHTVNAYIDMENREGGSAGVEESDETNNELLGTFQITGQQPDLVIRDISWEPENPKTEDQVTLSVTYANQGTLNPGKDFYLCLYVDESRIASEWVSDLQPGESAVYECSWTADRDNMDGDHTVSAYIDMKDKEGNAACVEESDETNNELLSTFQVAGQKPDLAIEEITWDPASPKTGEEVTFSVKYGNRGGLSAGKNFYICLYVDGSRLGYKYVDNLPAGESAVYECPWTPDREAEGGEHTVTAYIDMMDRDGYSSCIEESSETNNELSGTVKVEKTKSYGELELSITDEGTGSPVEGAEVYLDNTLAGTTGPEGIVRTEAVQGETHLINVRHPEYFEAVREVESGYEETAGEEINLVCMKVPLTLSVEDSSGLPVSEAEIYVDDELAGSTDVEGALKIQLFQESGVMVRAENENYYPAEGLIHVGTGEGFYTLTLKKEDPRAPTIEITGISEIGDGDSIYEDGEQVELNYRVSDESGIKDVLVKIDGSLIDSFHEEGAFSSTLGPLSAGEHLIRIEACDLDENGHKNLREIPLEISNRGPSVAFQCTKKEISVGETAVFDLGVMNPVGGKEMNVQLVIKPPSGVSVAGSYFASSGGGMYQAEYTLEPGSDVRTISLEMVGNEEGKHDIEADVFYSFEKDKTYSQRNTLTLDVNERPGNSRSPSQPSESIEETVEDMVARIPGFEGQGFEGLVPVIAAVSAFLVLALFLHRRKKA